MEFKEIPVVRWHVRNVRTVAVVAAAAIIVSCGAVSGAGTYFPESGASWQRRPPGELGLSQDLLDQAIAFAKEHETKYPEKLAAVADVRDLGQKIPLDIAREPFSTLLGPTKPRGALNGLVLRHGYIVAEWGETGRVDMTFSVTKTFLSSVAGVAYDRGLIHDIDDTVGAYVPTDHFASQDNAKITWDHLLRQTSDWRGTLWDRPAWADRPGEEPWSELARPPAEPGSHWKYNDVRVNLLALTLLHLFREPLPQVLRQHVMDPIGASNTWRWHGYRNSWVVIDGVRMQSVSGGGHWGGGMFISARDLARLGYLGLRRGRWGDRQILSEAWIRMAMTPTPGKKTYGFMNWFLNTDRELLPSAPENSFYFAGSGSNIVYVDPVNDLVAVVRWIERDAVDGFIGRVLGAIEGEDRASLP